MARPPRGSSSARSSWASTPWASRASAPLEAAARYEAWLAAGRHGDDARGSRARSTASAAPNPRGCWRTCARCCAWRSATRPTRDAARDARLGRIARYAAGEDYHRVMRDKLRRARALDPHRALPRLALALVLGHRRHPRARLGRARGPRLDRQALRTAVADRWVRGSCSARCWSIANSSPIARRRPRALRHVHALHRRVPDARHRRALPGRRAALHLVPDHRAARTDPARAAAAGRRLDLRLRPVPGGLPVEPLRAAGARGAAARARRSRAGRSSAFSRSMRPRSATCSRPARSAAPVARASCATSAWRSAIAPTPRRCRRSRATLDRDPSPLVRGHAAWALGRIGRPHAAAAATRGVRALERAGRDDDAGVREEAALALVELRLG